MQLTKLWIVTTPGPISVLQDIVFGSNISGIARQLRGGFEPDAFTVMFTEEAEAMAEGQRRIEARDAFFRSMMKGGV